MILSYTCANLVVKPFIKNPWSSFCGTSSSFLLSLNPPNFLWQVNIKCKAIFFKGTYLNDGIFKSSVKGLSLPSALMNGNFDQIILVFFNSSHLDPSIMHIWQSQRVKSHGSTVYWCTALNCHINIFKHRRYRTWWDSYVKCLGFGSSSG